MRHRSVLPVALAGAAILAVAAPPTLAKGPGDPEAPVTLRLLVQDTRGRQSEAAALDLQRLADELTDGAIRIEPSFGGGEVLGPVAEGAYELGMVPSRDAGDQGVTSLDVLEAPFLIDNDALAVAVATSDIADRALAGLDAIGVTGLVMWPEDLRHLFAMDPSGRTFVHPDDVKDADVLAIAGPVGRELISTLGGRLYADDGVPTGDLAGSKDPDAQAGTLEGFVTGLWGAGLPLTTTTVAGDLVVFSKYQMLVANPDMLAGLTDAQRERFQAVVDAAHEAALDRHFSERELALALCTSGHTVIEAGPEALATWRTAAQPLTDRLAADPLTGELMADVGYLAAEIAPSPGAGTCGPPVDSEVAGLVSDTSGFRGSLPPDGSYRATITADELLAEGVDPRWARDNAGTFTWTFEAGSAEAASVTLEADPFGGVPCTGTAQSEGGQLVYLDTLVGGSCDLDFSIVWRPVSDGIEMVLVAPHWEGTASEFEDLQRHLEGRTWLRLDGPMPSIAIPAVVSAMPYPGVWRIEQTVESLEALGMTPDEATASAGSITVTFDGDGYTFEATQGPDRTVATCGGPYRYRDGLVVLQQTMDPLACGTLPIALHWTASGVEQAVVTLPGLADPGYRVLAGRWTRVGDPPGYTGDQEPPPGIYRVELSAEALVERGAAQRYASEMAGTWTYILTPGRWSAENDRMGRCAGASEVRDGAVHWSDDLAPGDWCLMAGTWRWRPEANGIRSLFMPVGSETPTDLQNYHAFNSFVMERVGDIPSPSAEPVAFIGDRLPPAGTYRVVLTVDDLVAEGASRDFAGRNVGTWDWTFTGDAWSATNGREECGAPMRVADGFIELDDNPTAPCTLAYDLRWREEGDGLRFEVLDVNWVQATPQLLADERAFTERVWTRISDVPEPSDRAWVTDRLPPDGSYRIALTEEDLRARGASPGFARDSEGVWTWTLIGGDWTLTSQQPEERCTGTSTLTDGVIDVVDVAGDCAFGGRYQWRETSDGIELHLLSLPASVGGSLEENRMAIDRVWVRVQ